MSKVKRQSALVGHRRDGRFGADSGEKAGVTLVELERSAIAQINGAPVESALQDLLGLEESLQANRAALASGYDLIWNGPGKWLAVSDAEDSAGLVLDLRNRLEDTGATVTDLSQARTVVRISGANSCDVLCKGCPADIESMRSGDSMATLMGTLSSVVHCREAGGSFDVYVFRSFGQSFWEWLTDAALEFGYSAGG